MAQDIPRCVFNYLKTKFKVKINDQLSVETTKYEKAKEFDG
jgi:hypothetical protein